MNMEIEQEGSIGILYASGKIDAVTCAALQEKLNSLIESGVVQVILDCQDVAYISSAGLRVILATAKKLQKTGKFIISSASGNVYSVFEMVGLARIMNLCDTLDEAKAMMAE